MYYVNINSIAVIRKAIYLHSCVYHVVKIIEY